MSGQAWTPTEAQRAVLKVFFAVQDHGHFSQESQAATREMLDAFDREREEAEESL